MKGERTTLTTRMKTSIRTMAVIVVASLAATIVTVSMAVVPASIVKPAYAQLDDISETGEIEIPELDDISGRVEEIISSQPVPALPEQASATPRVWIPPALADYTQ
jgi:hypothetical protein